MRSHQQLLGGFPEVCPCPVESHSGSQAPSPRQSARDVGNPQHSSLRACQHPNNPFIPCHLPMLACPLGSTLEVMGRRTLVVPQRWGHRLDLPVPEARTNLGMEVSVCLERVQQ